MKRILFIIALLSTLRASAQVDSFYYYDRITDSGLAHYHYPIVVRNDTLGDAYVIKTQVGYFAYVPPAWGLSPDELAMQFSIIALMSDMWECIDVNDGRVFFYPVYSGPADQDTEAAWSFWIAFSRAYHKKIKGYGLR